MTLSDAEVESAQRIARRACRAAGTEATRAGLRQAINGMVGRLLIAGWSMPDAVERGLAFGNRIIAEMHIAAGQRMMVH